MSLKAFDETFRSGARADLPEPIIPDDDYTDTDPDTPRTRTRPQRLRVKAPTRQKRRWSRVATKQPTIIYVPQTVPAAAPAKSKWPEAVGGIGGMACFYGLFLVIGAHSAGWFIVWIAGVIATLFISTRSWEG